jgi:acyl-CoA-binding protein
VACKRWKAWTELGGMEMEHARELYVEMVQNDAPHWWW